MTGTRHPTDSLYFERMGMGERARVSRMGCVGASISLAVMLAAAVTSARADALRPEDLRATAAFELVVERSRVLTPGQSRIVAKSAVATRARGLMPGNSAGLEILFLSQPISTTSRADLLQRHVRDLRKHDHALLVLFLNAQGKIWQANLNYVITGTTVARTVAWQRESLAQFSGYALDGKRVALKSKGHYRESNDEHLTLSWNIDVRVPVLDPISR